jgi:luciferase family oxidoreductase group 1
MPRSLKARLKLSVLDQSLVPDGSTPADALANTVDLAKHAETLGYTRYWFAEHHGMVAFASASPEILIARVGAETKSIRLGSGALLIVHYSPLRVAETFSLLHCLYPYRIDLGVGRGPGTTSEQALALMKPCSRSLTPDDFPTQVRELMSFLHQHQNQKLANGIRVSPQIRGTPDVWLLGSSLKSAKLAAQMGLPYAVGHFVDPLATVKALRYYRDHFKKSKDNPVPRSILAIAAICADDLETATKLYRSAQVLVRRGGDDFKIANPNQIAQRHVGGAQLSPTPETKGADWNYVLGTPPQVKKAILKIIDGLQIDEVMIASVVHSHVARKRSYELLAQAFELARTT